MKPIAVIFFAFIPVNLLAQSDVPSGIRIDVKEKAVEFHIEDSDTGKVLVIPRFQNPIKNVYLKSDPQKTNLRLKPGISKWEIHSSKNIARNSVVVMETVGQPHLDTKPVVYSPNDKGEIVLPAHGAIVHGEKLRYEPQPHKNTVGYWQNEDDWCEWKFSSPVNSKYQIFLLQGCGKGQGGSVVSCKIGNHKIEFEVEDTGHFQNFKERLIGEIPVKSGKGLSVSLIPLNKAKAAVMDVRQLRLVPTKSTAETKGR